MSKQTAVEWLVEQLECFGNKHELQLSWATVDELVEQAKEMHKQEVTDAWEDGHDSFSTRNAEQYYKETFKQQ